MVALKKLMVFILVFAILIILKEIMAFVVAYKKNEKIDMTIQKQIIIGCAISYIMTIICTGFNLF